MNADIFRGIIRKYMELRHIRTMEQLRKHTTVGSDNTFRKYFKNPELIPMGVFLQLMDALNVPQDERMEIMKGGKR